MNLEEGGMSVEKIVLWLNSSERACTAVGGIRMVPQAGRPLRRTWMCGLKKRGTIKPEYYFLEGGC